MGVPRDKSCRRSLDAAHLDKIVVSMATGVSQAVAAKAANICDRTLRYWLYAGKDANQKREKLDPATGLPGVLTERETMLADFYMRYQQAQAQAESTMLDIIRKEAPKTWQAAAWFLERVYPQRYSRRDRFEHSGPNGRPIQTQTVMLEEIDSAVRAARENDGAVGLPVRSRSEEPEPGPNGDLH